MAAHFPNHGSKRRSVLSCIALKSDVCFSTNAPLPIFLFVVLAVPCLGIHVLGSVFCSLFFPLSPALPVLCFSLDSPYFPLCVLYFSLYVVLAVLCLGIHVLESVFCLLLFFFGPLPSLSSCASLSKCPLFSSFFFFSTLFVQQEIDILESVFCPLLFPLCPVHSLSLYPSP